MLDDTLVAVTSVDDSYATDAELTEDRRAAAECAAVDYDPEGYYRTEIERDDAINELVALLPESATISVGQTRRVERVAGQWIRTGGWMVHLGNEGEASVTGFGHTPTEACDAAAANWRKAHAVTRARPEYRSLRADTYESFGVIDPATAADFLAAVGHHHGRSDFLAIDDAGRVTLYSGMVGPDEAHAIGDYLARHNAACAAPLFVESAA